MVALPLGQVVVLVLMVAQAVVVAAPVTTLAGLLVMLKHHLGKQLFVPRRPSRLSVRIPTDSVAVVVFGGCGAAAAAALLLVVTRHGQVQHG